MRTKGEANSASNHEAVNVPSRLSRFALLKRTETKKSAESPVVRRGDTVPRSLDPLRRDAPSWLAIKRKRRGVTLGRVLFLLLVVLPTALTAIYIGLIASDRYVSTAEVTLENVSSTNAPPPSNSAIVTNTTIGLSSAEIVLMQATADFMASHSVVDSLQEKLDLRALWGTKQADWLYRLTSDANSQDLYDYFQYRVNPSFDQSTGLITLTVEAFQPGEAQRIAQAIIRLSTERFAELDKTLRSAPVRFAESEVKHYWTDFENAQVATQRFRNEHSDINTSTSATSIGTIVAGIEQQLSDSRANLLSMQTTLGPNAPSAVNVKKRIEALELQLQTQKTRLGSTKSDNGSTYADVLTQYARLMLEEGFASTAYTSALTDLVIARFQANQPHFVMIPFIEPQLPARCHSVNWTCSSMEPNRMLTIIEVFAGCLVAYGMIMLIIGAVRAHSLSH